MAHTSRIVGMKMGDVLAGVADALSDGLWSVDDKGCVTYANLPLAKMLKTTREELVGCAAFDFVFDEDRELAMKLFDFSKQRSSDQVDFRLRAADGSAVWIHCKNSPIFDEKGHVEGVVAIVQETDSPEELIEARALADAIVDSSDDAIVSKTTEGIIRSWNKGAERMFGYTEEEAIGNPITLIVPHDRKYEEVDILARICRGEKVDHFETVRLRKDGTYVAVSVTISPIRNSRGHVVGASKVARDIGEQKQAKERMQHELEQLVNLRTVQIEKSNKELEGFTYSVSHDLRGPLRSIVSSCMILREDFGPNLPAEAQEELAKQAKAAKRMADLIDDLLKLSRLARQEMVKTDLNLTAIAQEVADELHSGGTECDFVIASDLQAYGDRQTVKLLMANLMENACKFSNQTGPVEVGIEDGAFFVRDHGIGFDSQYAEKMFLPFERLVLDRDYPGTGIGLANVKRIVDRHGGRVWASSEGPDKGATFRFCLPDASTNQTCEI